MTRKQKRLSIILSSMILGGFAILLIVIAAKDNLLYFHSPSDIIAQSPEANKRIRMGGMVVENSIRKTETTVNYFAVTDYAETIEVEFNGILPDLFRECQGVVAEGVVNENNIFIADTVLAKHDESYMPPEVAESLKQEQGGREIGCKSYNEAQG